jgi:CheY-like chemotaxis protein
MGEPPSVLVADANADTRELYRNLLNATGLNVREASDGRDALVQALAIRPPVAIVDARLPFIDGLELCALLHGDPLTASTRVLLVTGDGSPEQVRRCRQRGADAVFVKPVSIEELVGAVLAAVTAATSDPVPAVQPPVAPVLNRAPAKARTHERYVSTNPPRPPPHLRCPHCDTPLAYDRSHVGGVSERHPEQWDYFICARHGTFQYRHRTRKLRAAS